MQNKEFLIIAHRGESYDAPENTLASINLAWKRDADGVEIDVQLTKDDKIVLIHDKTTLRTGSKYKRIAANNYDGLLKIDVGKFKNTKWKNERIPLLDEAIDTIPGNKILFIEIKSDEKIIKPLQNLIEQKNINLAQIKFIGFNIYMMELIKKTFPEIGSYWIVEGKNYRTKGLLKKTIIKCNSAKLDGLDVQARKYLNKDVIHSVKNSGLKIYTWTVDDPERAKQLYLDGIDGITTNKAAWLKNKLKE
ncbi:MAG: glycerophosphodiester phosphodiesterase family protein [Ignavibacteria bacterium]|nr:glycerophosphodiester phosphodiesterase family protein [Ignavibacteria bacterium]